MPIPSAAANWPRLEDCMKLHHCCALGLSIVMGGALSYSQQAPVPFAQILRDTQLSTVKATLHSDSSSEAVPDSSAGSSSSALPAAPAPAASASSAEFKIMPAARSPRIIDAKYLALNGLHLTMAIADIEMTQHCIDAHTCREGNPLMPSSFAGKIGVNLGIVGYTAAGSYWFKKHESKKWWIMPIVGSAVHTVGLASGLAYR
jgi:hypothetical protein